MEEYVRYKRKNGNVYSWGAKLYTPVTKRVKKQFDAIAKRYRLSQAELGAVIVMHYLSNRVLTVLAVREYRNTKRRVHQERLRELNYGKKSSLEYGFNATLGDEFSGWFEGLGDEGEL